MKSLAESLVLVLGVGESGLAMARWCAREGARLRVADSRAQPPGLAVLQAAVPAAEIALGEFDERLLDGVDLVAVSPGIDLRTAVPAAARRRGIDVVGEMTLFAQALERHGARAATRIIAITGTNGKTTTTALTAALCRAAGLEAVAAGNISPAALAVLHERLDAGQPLPACWVLELSSFQLEAMRGLAADAATVLNVTDDHLDRHGDMATYAAIKARVFDGDGVQVLNRDDPYVRTMARPGRRVVSFGADAPRAAHDFGLVREGGDVWLARGGERLLRAAQMRLSGLHNAVNALAALALGEAVGAALAPMIAALQAFEGLPHRMQVVARRADDVLFYDDSKGTNVGSTLAALQGLDRRIVLIAGGDGKGQDFAPLRPVVGEHARAVVLIGRDAPEIAAALAGLDVLIERAPDLDAAVVRANALAQPGDAVLLSPACASLDMFRNYAHRAEVFVAAVLRLAQVVPAESAAARPSERGALAPATPPRRGKGGRA